MNPVVIACVNLWLPRAAMAPRRNAQAVLRLLQVSERREKMIKALRRAGHCDEASYLADEERWSESARVCEEHRALTVLESGYPEGWRRLPSAPMVVWRQGGVPENRWIAGVGSRRVDADTESFCQGIGTQAARLGRGLVSGAAEGCDQAALSGAYQAGAPTMALLPRGLRSQEPFMAEVLLSARPLGEPFSTAAAMERNTLIYAAAELAFVGHARLRAGGSWYGATEALRRKLCPLAVPPVGDEPGLRALCALGATVLRSPDELPLAISRREAALF
ncbi:hypothetical protein BH11ARM2_BH11ARM2_29390 [soil metagenome]